MSSEQTDTTVLIGIVKWFNSAKGYGFINPESGGADIFAHFSAVEMDGYRTLKAGQRVYYKLHDGPKGLHALHIRPVEDATAEQADTAQAEYV